MTAVTTVPFIDIAIGLGLCGSLGLGGVVLAKLRRLRLSADVVRTAVAELDAATTRACAAAAELKLAGEQAGAARGVIVDARSRADELEDMIGVARMVADRLEARAAEALARRRRRKPAEPAVHSSGQPVTPAGDNVLRLRRRRSS